MRTRVAFTDPSGGSGREDFPLSIAGTSFLTGKSYLCGLWQTRPPFSPDKVVAEYCAILKDYDIEVVHGDRYAGSWPAERFAAHGIRYIPSEKTKSEIFLEFLVLVNSGRVKLPNDKRLRGQFLALERKTSRAGKDSVDHPSGGFDDAANAVAGSLCLAAASAVRAYREPIFEVISVRKRRSDDAPDYPGESAREKEFGWTKLG